MLHTHTSVASKFCWAIICSSSVGLDNETNCCLFHLLNKILAVFHYFQPLTYVQLSCGVCIIRFHHTYCTTNMTWYSINFNVSQLSHETSKFVRTCKFVAIVLFYTWGAFNDIYVLLCGIWCHNGFLNSWGSADWIWCYL